MRTAGRIPVESDPWLHMSALAIKALLIAARTGNTELYCGMLDALIELGWTDMIESLRVRVDDLLRSNVPPREGELGREGKRLLEWLRAVAGDKRE